jgi:hypothetical protein
MGYHSEGGTGLTIRTKCQRRRRRRRRRRRKRRIKIGTYLLDYIIATSYFYAKDGISRFLQNAVTYLPD